MAHRILVVDDDRDVRRVLCRMLEGAGHAVTEAGEGCEALRQCREEVPDLVVTDIVMPDMEGLSTIRELRKRFPECPVIAVSGGGRIGPEDYLKLALKFGARFAFTKPVSRSELLDAIAQCLDRT